MRICAWVGVAGSLAIVLLPAEISIWAIFLMALGCSLMWPALWPLAMADLGKFTKAGSGLLTMAIAGGAVIPTVFGFLQWASGATMALAVNALFIIGVFSLFYKIMPFNLEVNQAFIAAILTIIGYAINDTVVVFDRIREYLGLYPKRNLKENVNNAINSTLSRTINTSGTTLVTLLAIFFFGGESIRAFIFALIIGVVVGTIATIFIATPVAYDLMSKRAKIDKE